MQYAHLLFFFFETLHIILNKINFLKIFYLYVRYSHIT